MAWRLFPFLLLISLGSASCGREAPRAEPENEAEFAVPVAAQPARRGSLRAIIRTTGVVTPRSEIRVRRAGSAKRTRHIMASGHGLAPFSFSPPHFSGERLVRARGAACRT